MAGAPQQARHSASAQFNTTFDHTGVQVECVARIESGIVRSPCKTDGAFLTWVKPGRPIDRHHLPNAVWEQLLESTAT